MAITGIGLVSPLGHDPDTAWESLRRGTSQPVVHEHRLGDEIWGRFPLFRVDGFDARQLPLPEEARSYAESNALWEDEDLMVLVGALVRAVEDAALPDTTGRSRNCARNCARRPRPHPRNARSCCASWRSWPVNCTRTRASTVT
ncbi:MAG: hypothetical protein ACE5G2_11020 [Candidatus Krumholzibacteriia bacterium]